MLVLTAADVEALLPMEAAIAAVRGAMVQVSEGQAVLPLRHFIDIPQSSGGKLVVMPGSVPGVFGVKTVAKYNHPPGSPFGSHVGTVQLFDAATGLLEAIVEGSSLTSIRTAAASALATDLLARGDARVLAILGTGEQARRHVAAMRAVRDVRTVQIWGRTRAFAAALAEDVGGDVRVFDSVAEAVMGADIICTTTAAKSPILFGADVPAGAHVNLVGAPVRTAAEADGALVARSEFYVDYKVAAMAAAGELLDAIDAGLVDAGHVRGEIGELVLGRVPGRSDAEAVTVYKSLGVTAQDLAAGMAVLSAARAAGRGTLLDLV